MLTAPQVTVLAPCPSGIALPPWGPRAKSVGLTAVSAMPRLSMSKKQVRPGVGMESGSVVLALPREQREQRRLQPCPFSAFLPTETP